MTDIGRGGHPSEKDLSGRLPDVPPGPGPGTIGLYSYGPSLYGLGEILSVTPGPARDPEETAMTRHEGPRIVYAVTDGEYSDFRYKAIFEDRADADQARANGLGYDVQEIRYYPKGAAPPTMVTVWKAGAEVDPDGSFWCGAAHPRVYGSDRLWTSDTHLPDLSRPVVNAHGSTSGRTYIRVAAATEEAALKACSDRTAKLRAEILEGHHLPFSDRPGYDETWRPA